MNVQKYVVVIAASLITAAGMVGIAAHTNGARAAVSAADAGPVARTVQTLPTIHVSPTPEQLAELRGR